MSAVGILRPDEVIFYHPLDENRVEHTQSQTWTGLSGSTAGKVGEANSAIAGTTMGFGASKATSSAIGGGQFIRTGVAKLDATRFVIAYAVGNNVVANVGTISGSDITFGADQVASTIGNAGSLGALVTALDSTHVFILFHHGTGGARLRSVAGIVAGDTISFGSVTTAHPTGGDSDSNCDDMGSLATLDATHVVFIYLQNLGASFPEQVKVAEVVGTTITMGAGVNVTTTSPAFSAASVAVLSATTFVTVARDNSFGADQAQIGTVTGTTITLGSKIGLPGGISMNESTIVALSSTLFVVNFFDVNVGAGTAIVGVVSGTDITFGSETLWTAAVVTISSLVTVPLSSTTFAFAYRDGRDSNHGTAQIGTVTGTSLAFGVEAEFTSASSADSLGLLAMDSATLVVSYRDEGNSNLASAKVGLLGQSSTLTAPTPAAYPSAIGHDRVVMAMWARNLTGSTSTATIERGYIVDMTATTISLGGTTAVWSAAAIATLMTTMNDGSSHLLVLDFENTGGTNWTLRTSVDGAAFASQGAQTSGTQVVATADTDPNISIADGATSQWVDELVMWAGDKTSFESFTTQELANLNDLADTFGETMDQFEENFGAPLCWQATARMPDGTVWRDSGSGPCPPVVRVPRGAGDIIVTDDGAPANPRIQEG